MIEYRGVRKVSKEENIVDEYLKYQKTNIRFRV